MKEIRYKEPHNSTEYIHDLQTDEWFVKTWLSIDEEPRKIPYGHVPKWVRKLEKKERGKE